MFAHNSEHAQNRIASSYLMDGKRRFCADKIPPATLAYIMEGNFAKVD